MEIKDAKKKKATYEDCMLIGWSINNCGEDAIPDNRKLKQARVTLYDFEKCKKLWKKTKVLVGRKPILKEHVCAGPPHIFEVVYLITSNFWCKSKRK